MLVNLAVVSASGHLEATMALLVPRNVKLAISLRRIALPEERFSRMLEFLALQGPPQRGIRTNFVYKSYRRRSNWWRWSHVVVLAGQNFLGCFRPKASTQAGGLGMLVVKFGQICSPPLPYIAVLSPAVRVEKQSNNNWTRGWKGRKKILKKQERSRISAPHPPQPCRTTKQPRSYPTEGISTAARHIPRPFPCSLSAPQSSLGPLNVISSG